MPCFSCGQTFNGSVKELLIRFKRDFINNGTERYFFRLKTNGDIKVVKKSQFKAIFETQIKPNFKYGAEYAHISEYKS